MKQRWDTLCKLGKRIGWLVLFIMSDIATIAQVYSYFFSVTVYYPCGNSIIYYKSNIHALDRFIHQVDSVGQRYTIVASAVMLRVKGTATDALTNGSRSYSMFVFKKRYGRHGDAFPSGVSGNDSGLVADSAGITWMEEVSATSSVPAGGSEIST